MGAHFPFSLFRWEVFSFPSGEGMRKRKSERERERKIYIERVRMRVRGQGEAYSGYRRQPVEYAQHSR